MKQRTARWFYPIVLLLSIAAAYAPVQSNVTVRAAVTLRSFLAESEDGVAEVYITWETATEFDTSGFYVVRSETYGPDSSYVRVSSYEPARGDSISGWQYDVVDDTVELNKLYYYKLEEIPSDQGKPSLFYGPVVVIAGRSETPTPTVTSTLTPTPTSTPTATPTEVGQSSSPISSTPVVTARAVTTPGLAAGATVTPRPTTVAAGNSEPASAGATSLPASQADPAAPQPETATTPAALAQNTSAQPAVAPPAPAQTVMPEMLPHGSTGAADNSGSVMPAVPIVIPVETPAAAAPTTNFSGGVPLLLIGLALLLLGGGLYLILRQTSR